VSSQIRKSCLDNYDKACHASSWCQHRSPRISATGCHPTDDRNVVFNYERPLDLVFGNAGTSPQPETRKVSKRAGIQADLQLFVDLRNPAPQSTRRPQSHVPNP